MGRKGGAVRVKQVGAKKMPKMTNPMEALAIPPDEMIHLPPPPDRSYQFFWPMHETFRMDPSKFIAIYPSYLDSTKSIRQGRRIGKEQAVPCPTVSDLSQALQQLNLKHVIQPYKGYPRDTTTLWDNPGRVKVDYDGDGEDFADMVGADGFDVDNLPDIGNEKEGLTTKNSKRVLMIELARRIKTLPARIERLKRAEEEAKKLQAERLKEEKAEKERQAALQRQQNQRQKQQSTSNKKKGKKKK